jgi:hypothetical protein
MNPSQRLLVGRTLRVVVWVCVAWLLILVATAAWASWQASSPREYQLNPPTSQDRALETLRETVGGLSSERAWSFWGPLGLGFAAFWARRFLVLGQDSDASADPPDKED